MKPAGLILASCNLAIAGLQLFFFLPVVVGGKSLDVTLWDGGPPLFRLDGLSLLFGVAWTLALALATLAIEHSDKQWGWTLLITAGLLVVAYAREPIVFFVAWELAGLGVWLSMPALPGAQSRIRLAALIHGAGLPLLLLVAIGGVEAFVPPEGGAIREWQLGAVALLGLTVLLRTFSPALYQVNGQTSSQRTMLLWVVYAYTGPFLLAKALVEARWDAWGIWALTLAGTAMLLAIVIASLRGTMPLQAGSMALMAVAIIGLGLAPAASLAAMGAILLVGLGSFLPLLSPADRAHQYSEWASAAIFAGSIAGIWLVVQGALLSRYAMVAVILLPAILIAAAYRGSGIVHHKAVTSTRRIAIVVALLICVLLAVYPQASIAWFARPIVAALAGGVGVSNGLATNWGLGLTSAISGEALSAALPATGIALAVFLAWVALYWLRGLLRMLLKRDGSNDS